ncbi:unnamed protein product [Ilex paraguariensis]|uniref:Uncharacterized protein n=1 Tax=Ilex paraguariensis TaxID=185542 RepID=A0ABC8RJU5_9AQUA
MIRLEAYMASLMLLLEALMRYCQDIHDLAVPLPGEKWKEIEHVTCENLMKRQWTTDEVSSSKHYHHCVWNWSTVESIDDNLQTWKIAEGCIWL